MVTLGFIISVVASILIGLIVGFLIGYAKGRADYQVIQYMGVAAGNPGFSLSDAMTKDVPQDYERTMVDQDLDRD